ITAEHQYLEPLNIAVLPTSNIPQPSRDLMSQAKVNFQLKHDHSLFVRYASQYGYVDNDFIGINAAFLTYANGVMDHNQQKLWNVSPGWAWVINPTTVNQVTAQFITWTHDQSYPGCNLPGINSCLSQRLSFPSGYTTGPIHAFPKWYNFEDKYEFKDDFSKQISRHALKFGADYASDGNWSLGAYAQDDFRVSSKVTLNLGLRYDVYEYMNQPNLDKNRTYLALKAIGSPYGALPQTDKNNFSPRIGFAWDVTGDGTNVVRGSYGTYYVMQIKNTYYQRNYLEKPTIFF